MRLKRTMTVLAIILITAAGNRRTAVNAGTDREYLSEEIQGYCVDVGEHYGICPELLMAIIETESAGKKTAQNGNCIGLMQVNQAVHKGRAEKLGVTDLWDEYGNILVGADLLNELFRTNQEVSWALDKYNGNSKATYNYENGILSPYAKRILERSAELEELRGK